MYQLNSFSFKILGKEEKESTTDESQENSLSTIDDVIREKKPSINISINHKKKHHDICYTLELLKNDGNFIIEQKENNKLFIIKIRKVDFSDSHELFEKGRNNIGNNIKDEMGIPDITFWNQRYYYYSLFDKGINMDCESIIKK